MEGSYKRQLMLGVIMLFSVLAVMVPVVGQAAELPAVEQLKGITMDKSALWSPSRLTVGPDGTLYVVDSYKNHILKFDRSGSYLGDISAPRVSAIAIAPDGTLYIGSHQNNAVSIVKNGRIVGYLGASSDEFRSIRDIAYDASAGTVYVVDNVGNAVRVFDAAGLDKGSISGVNLPIAIDVTPDAIYVIDSPIVQDAAAPTTSSRISIFDKSYSLVRVIEDQSAGRIMYRPADIAVSGDIIYVADAALRSVIVFDSSGTFLGEIQSVTGEIYTALGLAISSDGILYVSSSDTHSIEVFMLTAQTGAGTKAGSSGN